MLDRLKTQDRLLRFGIQVGDVCCLCELQPESCHRLCLMAVKKWLNWNTQACNLQQLLRWIDRAKMSKFRKGVLAAATIGLRLGLKASGLLLFKKRYQMAQRGVWQLQKLIVNYCDWGGSSRGISVSSTLLVPPPLLSAAGACIGIYGVPTTSIKRVLHSAIRLRNSLGRKVVKLKTRHITKHPSVQGTWTTDFSPDKQKGTILERNVDADFATTE
ncbi:hypothetical protein G4B88_028013 [Cannabis sativa]|uniref:Uncharacterized protein n=1 Tax=Cannabis sativa TaxID=3483 RepID=A0A7J6I6L2_CANSA|nr:hypothetical protein G4B88_028013 [Cannabis sativa]